MLKHCWMFFKYRCLGLAMMAAGMVAAFLLAALVALVSPDAAVYVAGVGYFAVATVGIVWTARRYKRALSADEPAAP